MSILAGMMIAIGCILYLTIGGVTGAVLFSVGLMTVCQYKLKLFTGQAYKLVTKEISIKELAAVWLGNLFGVLLMVALTTALPNSVALRDKAMEIMQSREQVGPAASFFLAIPCGILMTFAVKQPSQLLYIAFCVAAFILGGFYHCVADMFYTLLGATTLPQFLNLLFVTLGNIIGCTLYPLIHNIRPYQ